MQVVHPRDARYCAHGVAQLSNVDVCGRPFEQDVRRFSHQAPGAGEMNKPIPAETSGSTQNQPVAHITAPPAITPTEVRRSEMTSK